MSQPQNRGPLPPEELCYRVAGTRDHDWFDRSGAITTDLYGHCLDKLGAKLTDFPTILDWGCGCGRVHHPRLKDLKAMLQELDEKGFVFWDGDGWEQHFPDFYNTTFHTHEYIRRHWSQWFNVMHVQKGTDEMPQEVVVLRRS